MAITLADMYLLSPYLFEKGIIKTLQEESQLIDSLSFENVEALTVQTYRSGKLQPVSWRKINEPFGSVIQGKPEPVQAGIFSFGNNIDIDYLVKRDKTPKIVDPMTQQINDTMVTMARQFNDAWVNNTPMKDPQAITGVRYMINEEFPGQKICANPAGNAALDLTPTGANYASNISIFFLMLDKAINAIDGLSCQVPSGAFYIFINCKDVCARTGMTSQELAEYLLENCGICLVAGSVFGTAGEGYIRMSFANSYENIVEGCRILGEAVRDLMNKA